MSFKQFKDPIYGYIQIPSNMVENIIDTDVFQRLRRIIQTSYSPLYPSAIHNRFVHSIGVYYLGSIACDSMINSIKYNNDICIDIDLDRLRNIFLLACLLHDVGHAPFSHTGEKFYLDNNRYHKLHQELADCVEKDSFKKDIPKENSKSAAPHEVMSAIIGITSFEAHFKDEFDKEFFARCITGYLYSENNDNNNIYNCFISMLNSKVIDVDRLDYLIRDAYFTGFETVNLDYIRLLKSIRIVKENHTDSKYEIAYNKNAISIIENVVYAHDAERKWIQTHPTVLYDMYIIQHILNGLNRSTSTKEVSLFSRQSLTAEGTELSNGSRVSLLCDDDIVHLLKSQKNDDLCLEFFSRNKRRHPLWKSEAEYKAYLSLAYGGDTLEKLKFAFEQIEKYVRMNTDSWLINDNVLSVLREELAKIKKEGNTSIDEKTLKTQITAKEAMLKLVNCMSEYSKECECEFSFVILKASQFFSGFNKNEFGGIKIVFPQKQTDNIFDFRRVVSTLNSPSYQERSSEFFYLYVKDAKNSNFNKEYFCKKLYQAFM